MVTTLNGWTAVRNYPDGRFVAPNGKTVYCRNNDVATVFEYIAKRWHKEIEPLPKADYNTYPNERKGLIVIHAYRPFSANVGVGSVSNHHSGTAMDVNGHLHPYEPYVHGTYWDGFTHAQRGQLRDIARAVKDDRGNSIIRLGIDFARGRRDGMHVEIAPGTSATQVEQAARRIRGGGSGKGDKPLPIRASIEKGGHAPVLTSIIQKRVQYFVPQRVDGVFGPKTRAGVIELQKALGVEADGIVGPSTVRADLAFHGTMRRGTENHGVRWVQYIVNVKPDGVYGPNTEAAVKECQRWAGITVDGVFGPTSRSRLVI